MLVPLCDTNTSAALPNIAPQMEINCQQDYYDFFLTLEMDERYRSEAQCIVSDLKCTNLKVRDLPGSVKHLRSLKTLDVSNNSIVNLPNEIGELTELRSLSASNNYLLGLPDKFGSLINLRQLVLENNRLTTIPQYALPLLRMLNLNNNIIQSLIDNDQTLPSLEYLYLARNGLKSFEKKHGIYYPNLKVLDVSTNELKGLPNSIWKLGTLEKLNADNNQLQSLPETIIMLAALQSLRCSNNKIREFPANMERLQSLREIIANDNQVTSIPEGISALCNGLSPYSQYQQNTKLKVLQLAGNPLRNIPQSLPEEIRRTLLAPLQSPSHQQYNQPKPYTPATSRFHATPQSQTPSSTSSSRYAPSPTNSMNSQHNAAPQANQSVLALLDRQMNAQELFHMAQHNPQGLQQIAPSVVTLDLSGIQLHGHINECLVDIAQRFPNLRSLNISNNNLSILPEEIGLLHQLKKLDASNNQLYTIPNAIFGLQALSSINIANNLFPGYKIIVDSLKRFLPNLTEIDGNSVSHQPIPQRQPILSPSAQQLNPFSSQFNINRTGGWK